MFQVQDWNGDELQSFVDAENQLSIDIYNLGDGSPAANVELKLYQAEAFANWILKEVENARRAQQQ